MKRCVLNDTGSPHSLPMLPQVSGKIGAPMHLGRQLVKISEDLWCCALDFRFSHTEDLNCMVLYIIPCICQAVISITFSYEVLYIIPHTIEFSLRWFYSFY